MPSLRSSIGAGCRPISFGADLNFVRPKPRTFPGLTAPGSARARRQDLVRSSHGVCTVDEFRAHRATPWWQLGRAHAVVCRAVPRNGLCAAHLARESARHRGQPVGQYQQAVCDGLSLGGQALHAGRRQRIARLANLVGPCCFADSPCTQALRGRLRARCRIGTPSMRWIPAPSICV